MIRRADAEVRIAEALVLDLGDLHRHGEELRARAKADAERLLADARRQRESVLAGAQEEGRRQGYEQGLAEGREQGRAEGHAAALAEAREQIGELMQMWLGLLEQFLATRDEMLQSARADVLRLGVAFAERLARRAIEIDPGVVARQIEAAIAASARASSLVVSVHPDDEGVAREILPALVARLRSGAHAELVLDPSLARGSGVVRTPNGEVDASIDTQLDRMVRALLPDPADGQGAPGGAGGEGAA